MNSKKFESREDTTNRDIKGIKSFQNLPFGLGPIFYLCLFFIFLFSFNSCALLKHIEASLKGKDPEAQALILKELQKSNLLKQTASAVKFERGDKYKSLDLAAIARELEKIELGSKASLVKGLDKSDPLVKRLEVPEVSSGIDSLIKKSNSSKASAAKIDLSKADLSKIDKVLQARLERDNQLIDNPDKEDTIGAEVLAVKTKNALKNLEPEIEEMEKKGLRGLGDKEDAKSSAELALAALEKKQSSSPSKTNSKKDSEIAKNLKKNIAAAKKQEKAEQRASMKSEKEGASKGSLKKGEAKKSLIGSASKASDKLSPSEVLKLSQENKIPVWVFLLMAASLSIAGFGLLWVSKNS